MPELMDILNVKKLMVGRNDEKTDGLGRGFGQWS